MQNLSSENWASWTKKRSFVSFWSTSVQSLQALRSLCMSGVVSSTWLVASHLAWSSTIYTGRFFGVLKMPWPRFKQGAGQQEVEDWLVEIGMKSGWLSASNRLFITCSIWAIKGKYQREGLFSPPVGSSSQSITCTAMSWCDFNYEESKIEHAWHMIDQLFCQMVSPLSMDWVKPR